MSEEKPFLRDVDLPTTCPKCHGEASVAYCEFTVSLKFTLWTTCPRCGPIEHGVGWDEPHEAFDPVRSSPARDAMLTKYGEWALVLESPPSVVFLRTLRELFALSLDELKQEKARLPGIVRRGTRARIEFLAERLRGSGCPDTIVLQQTLPSLTEGISAVE